MTIDDLPDHPAGRHHGRPKRYWRVSPSVEDEWICPPRWPSRPAAATAGSRLVGDWIDRSVGDLAPLWSDDVLVAAIAAAHAAGARVTAHVFGDGRPARPHRRGVSTASAWNGADRTSR